MWLARLDHCMREKNQSRKLVSQATQGCGLRD